MKSKKNNNKMATKNSLFVDMNDETALAVFENMDLGMEPENGVIQPPVYPPDGKPHRNTNALQYVYKIVLTAVSKHHLSRSFLTPVNAIKLKLPDYHSIIKHPMDLKTIKKRLENDYYYDVKECIKDFQILFYNCYKYNKPGEDIVRMCQTLEKFFVEKMAGCPKEAKEVQIPARSLGGKGKGKKGKGAFPQKVGVSNLNTPVDSKFPTTSSSNVKNCISTDKKGVKRKADTTTSSASTYELLPSPPPEKEPKISNLHESGRPIKKPSKDFPETPALNEVA